MEEKTLSSLSSHPLFSTLLAFYILVLIYFPSLFLPIVLSPVLISTAILLLTLLRLGSIQRTENEFNSIKVTEDPKWVSLESNYESGNENSVVSSTNLMETEVGSCSDQNNFYVESFIEWDVRAPLEVIYEEYEGEDEERNDDVRNEKAETTPVSAIERYGSLSLYYPESDSDGSSDGEDFAGFGGWDSPESMCFMWDEEKGEELIEIAFDGKRTSREVHFEEENLIEIDISPARC
ncbi:hypothetical protein Vadar_009521 [Vaccinium darrowii]|uniref:Uncharacterized protein n=1 Tax=Vaccinium darrowii TaxID=229202 RepID=A0ACB7YV39_9ERIC|nr:hypothetical protein Vadar_009521 [Vaccinium darrowii]